MTEIDFATLLERAKRGESSAREVLLQGLLPSLEAWVRLASPQRLRARESVRDLLQTICRQTLEHLHELEATSEGAFKRWLFEVAGTKLQQRQRYWGRQRRAAEREVALDDQALLACYARVCTPSQDAASREEIARIEAAFDALPEDHRRVIVLSRIVGLPSEEVASAMGRSVSAVRQLLCRARARLSMLLEPPL